MRVKIRSKFYSYVLKLLKFCKTKKYFYTCLQFTRCPKYSMDLAAICRGCNRFLRWCDKAVTSITHPQLGTPPKGSGTVTIWSNLSSSSLWEFKRPSSSSESCSTITRPMSLGAGVFCFSLVS